MTPLRTILHPTDFSATADHALQFAHSLARDHQARLIIVTVAPEAPLPLPQKYQYLEARKDYDAVVAEDRRQAESRAATINDIPVEVCLKRGEPGPSILATAEEFQADLIVMGTHGRTGIGRLFLGSVAEYLLRHANCPVLTIRPGTSEHLSHEEETSPATNRPKG